MSAQAPLESPTTTWGGEARRVEESVQGAPKPGFEPPQLPRQAISEKVLNDGLSLSDSSALLATTGRPAEVVPLFPPRFFLPTQVPAS